MDAGVVLKVLAESHGDDKLLFLLEHPTQGEIMASCRQSRPFIFSRVA